MKYESINLKNNEIEGAGDQEIKIEIIDLAPEREKTSTPVLFAPGWGITLETLNEPLNLLVEEGYRVLSLSHSRETLKINSDEHNLAELQKAYALLALLEQKNIEKVDAVAHSEGAINLIIAAIKHPEKFRNIVLVNPAGMMGKNTFPKHLFKYYSELFHDFKSSLQGEVSPVSVGREYKEIVKYFLSNPSLSIKEAVAISQADIIQTLKELKDYGIGVSVIAAVDDKIIPMEKIQENVYSGVVDGFYSVKGSHNSILLQSKEYIGVVDHALGALEAKGSIVE